MEKVIKYTNIIYMQTISALGGIETYVYELVKKYGNLDIAVVCKSCESSQAKRIREICPLYIHTNQRIECKVAIINYDTSIIDFINEDAEIYETIHGDYSNPIYTYKPPTHPRIKSYIALTEYLQGKVKELVNADNVIVSYNPLTITNKEKPLILVSATRLHKHKGKDRMVRLVNELDKRGINYIWYVITGDVGGINSPNVIFIKNRLDVDKWINQADYVVLLSDSEALSYTINEALYRNIPVICTPLPYLKEIGVEDGKNADIMEFDCSNVEEIADKITDIPKFKFKQLEDKYGELFKKVKSKYQEEKNKMYKVRCIRHEGYDDIELGRHIDYREEFEVNKLRAEYLEENKAIEILNEV